MIKVGDIVYVSNPDLEYESEFGERKHASFFGIVTGTFRCLGDDCAEVKFPKTTKGEEITWAYTVEELSLASDLKNEELEEVSEQLKNIKLSYT